MDRQLAFKCGSFQNYLNLLPFMEAYKASVFAILELPAFSFPFCKRRTARFTLSITADRAVQTGVLCIGYDF